MRSLLSAPTRPRLIQTLLGLTALIWLGFGLISLFRPVAPSTPALSQVVAGLMLANGGAFLAVGLGLGWPRGRRLAFLAGVFLVGVNLLLTITDQLGLWDILVLALNLALLALLAAGRAHYLSP